MPPKARRARAAPPAGRKPSRKPSIHPFKSNFFRAHLSRYYEARLLHDTAPFFTHITELYFQKFGYHSLQHNPLQRDVVAENSRAENPQERERMQNLFEATRARIQTWYRVFCMETA
ncbi:hypothetical protein DFH07DRAFT_972676 [Mycena maculata]|uniref:Uncharacterized protein n=1 Tax=Mycena maculata TaxID=230809 RepID=A0AAD7HHV5_9AGAR|nr:hypothetical protein DFH07DRAFT_972676 [Mycena maculata]